MTNTETRIAFHMSRTVRDWGIRIARTERGQYLVQQISPSPIYGQLTSLVIHQVATETEARKLANAHWQGLGL
jgi:hypothetical protein